MSPSCTFFEIKRDIGRKSLTVTYPTSIWRPCRALEFRQDVWHQKTKSPWAIIWRYL